MLGLCDENFGSLQQAHVVPSGGHGHGHAHWWPF